MLRAILIGALVTATACGKGAASDVVVAGAPAGSVRAITGKVTATRASVPRELKVGDAVAAADIIATAADATIAIELAHNHATWTLAGGQTVRVDASQAWSLAKATEPAGIASGDTSAAGRAAERAAAETAATAAKLDAERQRAMDKIDEKTAKIETAKPKTGGGKGAPSICAPDDPLCMPEESPSKIAAREKIAKDKALHACADKPTHFTLACKATHCTVKSASTDDGPARACVTKRLATMIFQPGEFSLDVELP